MSHHYNNNSSSYHDDVFRSVPCVAIEAPVNNSLRESYSNSSDTKKDSSSSLNHVSTTTPLQQLPTYHAPPPRVISAAATGFTSNRHRDEDEAPMQVDRDDYAATAAALNNPRRLSFLRPLQNTTISSHYCGGWGDDFSSSKIQTISNSYPLLPHHVILQQDNLVCLPRLLARLTNCFRRLSLQATYNHRPTLSATLYSIEGVELFVSLLQRRQCSKEDSTIIIVVQVQHICGDDSSCFHNYANKILSACLSSSSEEYDMMEDDNITTTTTPAMISSRKHVQGLLHMEQQRMCLEDTSDFCRMLGSMFRHEDTTKIYTCTFARHVLLQQLCVLCDASMMMMSNIDCAVYTSRAVLLGGTNHQNNIDGKETCSNKIHEFVMSILTSRGSSHVMDGNMLDSSSTRASRDVFLRALFVLSHSLETVRYYDDSDSMTFPSVVEQILQQDLVSLLLKELEHADTRPHEACVSAVCLRYLQTGSADVHEQVLQNLATVDHAIEIGIQYHVKLERQARALRSAVLNSCLFH